MPLSYGRTAFGGNPEAYEQARPGYPDEIYRWLDDICGIAGADLFEIGPGPGTATARLLALLPRSLVAIEPDVRLAEHLGATLGHQPQLKVVRASFEEAVLAPGSFDLGTAATAFHWLEQKPALAKVFGLLRPGGWWAMWWNFFGDPDEPDAFRDASAPLFRTLPSTRLGTPGDRPAFAFDRAERFAELAHAGFVGTRFEVARWPIVMDSAAMVALVATFSHVNALEDGKRVRFLDKIRDLVDRQFGGRIEQCGLTLLYLARRP